jgi:aminomethyltransferase
MNMDAKTPLFEAHQAAGGKMISFAGYTLPVQYKETSVIKEHLAVRNQAGLFDVSHMGEVMYEGPAALANLQYLLTNDFTNLETGRVRYTLMCNEAGGVIDDLLVYKLNEQKYLLVVNAANRAKDVAWMKQHLFRRSHPQRSIRSMGASSVARSQVQRNYCQANGRSGYS